MLAVFPAASGYSKAFVKTYQSHKNKWNTLGDSIPVANMLAPNPKSYGNGIYTT